MTQFSTESLLAEVLLRNEQSFQCVSEPTDVRETQPAMMLKALQRSGQSVFAKMCGIELTLIEKIQPGCAAHHHDVSGIIAISGGLQASIVLHFPRDLILSCAANFLGKRPATIDADTIDLVGELTNMVVGGAKEHMSHEVLSLGLPTVVSGRGHHVVFSSDMCAASLLFNSQYGILAIDVGLKS